MKRVVTLVSAGLAAAVLAGSAQGKESGAPPELDAWGACLRGAADKYVTHDAPIETIASAAFGACKAEEEAIYQRRVTRSFGARLILGPPDREDRKIAREAQDRMVAGVRDELIAYLLERRANPSH
jgi:hypothetical protein